jgi:hypothetical protein
LPLPYGLSGRENRRKVVVAKSISRSDRQEST